MLLRDAIVIRRTIRDCNCLEDAREIYLHDIQTKLTVQTARFHQLEGN